MPKDYSNLTKEQLIELVEKLEKKKKYGLVWDEEKIPEQVVLDCKESLPVLTEVKEREIHTSDNEPTHILIEGDNYHGLSVLNYTHAGKIDLIYIDPPYNTGAKDWKYNNNYVDENDTFRHSKWLSMMKSRLELSKYLLKDEGVFICAIDHNEFLNLGVLLDEIFGEHNKLGIVAVVHKPEGRNQAKFFGNSHEYMLFYAKNKESCSFRNVALTDESAQRFNLTDSKGSYRLKNFIRLSDGKYSLRENKPHFYYPIYVSQDYAELSLEEKDGFTKVFPITDSGQERTWKTTPETFKKRANAGDIVAINEDSKIVIYEKLRESEVLRTHWIDKRYHGYHYGTKLVQNILGAKKFDFPKSVHLIIDTLKITTDRNALILDFFAGSGTTGHATLELNRQDNGNRKFILCTNNENNISEEVCFPRLRNVMNGYEYTGTEQFVLFDKNITENTLRNIEDVFNELEEIKQDSKNNYDEFEVKIEDNSLRLIGITKNINNKRGLGNNLKYFKTSFVKNTENKDQLRIDITRRCTEMLCLKEEVYKLKKETADWKIFEEKDKFLAVYYDFPNASLDDLRDEMNALNGEKVLFCFTVDPSGLNKEDFSDWENIRLEPIPQKILDVYKQIFQ